MKTLGCVMKIFKVLSLFFILALVSELTPVHAQEKQGQISVLVYSESRPVKGFVLKLDDSSSLTTNDDGYVRTQTSSGRHKLQFEVGGKTQLVAVEVAHEEDTQVILNILDEKVQWESYAPERLQTEADLESVARGQLEGKLLSAGENKAVAGARIFVKGQPVSATSSAQGKFELKLPPGSYDISVLHKDYTTEMFNAVNVTLEKNQPLQWSMTPAGLELEDFLVLSPRMSGSVEALIEVRKSSASVADVMSAEQISKTGDGDAAASLRRVTGLTLVDGKFVYIRGLGERYSNTLYNGVVLPSPDPSRRVVPLDMFPTSVLESLVIQKSYSADRSGEFGGGSIFLKSKSFPEKFFFSASVSENFYSKNDGALKSYQGGSQDWLGKDDGTRALPDGLDFDRPSTGEALQSFENIHDTKDFEEQTPPSFQVSAGNGHKMGIFRVSYLGSLMYSDEWRQLDEAQYKYLSNGTQIENYARDRSQRTIKTGGLAGLGFGVTKNHTVNLDYLLVRNTTDDIYTTEGNNYENEDIRDTTLEWAERELQNTILSGEHRVPRLSRLKLKWHLSQSRAERYEPDRRNYRYLRNDQGEYEFYGFQKVTAEAYQRRFSRLAEDASDIGAEVILPFKIWESPVFNEFAIGYNRVVKDRQSQVRRYGLRKGELDPSSLGLQATDSLETIFRECFNPDCFQYSDDTRTTDNYTADQVTDAWYVNSKWAPSSTVNISVGARQEYSIQEVQSFMLFQPEATATVSRLETWDTLPSTSMTWKLTEKMQVRAAYSETVSRPDFKELSNTLWKDDERGFEVRGNPDLKAAFIKNYDLRWEWYFDRKDNISLGVFYKDFESPIEEVLRGQSDPVLTFANAQAAQNLGFEIEWSQSLNKLGRGLNGWSLGANYSYIESTIQLDPIAQADLTSKERPLQGQSPYVINGILDYEKETWKTNFSLVYNVFGKRISEVGVAGLKDIYEEPFHQMDVVLSQGLNENFTVKLKVQNLLAETSKYRQGDWLTREVDKGQVYSAGISGRF